MNKKITLLFTFFLITFTTFSQFDNTPPIITLIGANPQTINAGSAYTELNATASDDTDGNLSGNIVIDVSTVDINTAGSYTVTYNVSDAAGNNAAEVTRTVNVICTVDIQATPTNVSCLNSSDGSVALTPSGGTAPYTYGQTVFNNNFFGAVNFGDFSSTTMTTNANGTELELTPTSGWSSDFLSNQTFTREAGLTFEGSVFIPHSGYKAVMVGFNDDTGNGTNSLSHGVYFFDNGSTSDVTVTARFGANANAFPTGSYTNTTSPGTWFDFKIVLDGTNGASYSVKKSTDATYTNTFTSNSGNLSTFKIGVNSNNGGSTVATLHKNWRVYRAPNATTNLAAGIYTYFVRDANGCEDDVTVQIATEVDSEDPVITITGGDTIQHEALTPYTDAGASATDNCTASITNTVNNVPVNPTIGSYTVIYTATDGSNNQVTKTRIVNVVDTTIPVITLLTPGTQTLEVHSDYTSQELGATALDNYDGDISGDIVIDASNVNMALVGTYTVTYNVDDANSNSAVQVTRTIEVVDTTKPVITLTGANPQRIEYNENYTELGATATDNYDDDTTLTTTIVIDASNALAGIGTLGTYSVTYNVTDANGNIADTVTRTVIVEDTTKPNLTIIGDNPQLIEIIDGVDAVYVEQGATASDEYDVDVDDNDIVIDASALTPNLGNVGCYPVTYRVTDASGNTRVRTRIVFVLEEGIPWAKDDAFTVNEDSNNNILTIINNDSYGTDGARTLNPISLYGTYSTHGGKIDIVGSTVQYTPRAGFKGVDDFKYLITDATDDSRTATVIINVVEEPEPIAVDDIVTVIENSGINSIDILLNDSYGSDGAANLNAITISGTSSEGGLTVINAGKIDYTPATDFTGLDSFFYTIKDLDGDESTAVVLIKVIIDDSDQSGSRPIIAKPDSFTVDQNSGVNILNVLADNGSGADDFGSEGQIDNGLTMTNGMLSGISNKGGTISINNQGTASTLDDVIQYTPKVGFIGDDGFYYRITDANGATSIAIVTITVQEIATPIAVTDVVNVVQDSGVNSINVLENDSYGSDGAAATDSLTLPLGTSTAGGVIAVNDRKIDYTPFGGFIGQDTFTYTIKDGSGDQSSTTVTVNVIATALSDKPTAKDDVISVTQNTSNNIISVLLDNGNGADEFGTDGASPSNSISLYGNHSKHGGVLVLNGTTVEYTPRSGFTGVDEFKYLITDATNESSTATVTINVTSLVPKTASTSFENKDFMVYPNPSEGDVKISVFSNQPEEVSVILFDVTGKVVFNEKQLLSKGNNTVNLNVRVKAGILFLKVYSENTNFGTKKVVFK